MAAAGEFVAERAEIDLKDVIVLIVEDISICRRILQRMLMSMGIVPENILLAGNGSDADARCQQYTKLSGKRPHLTFMDFELTDGNVSDTDSGAAATQKLIRNKRLLLDDPIVIACTSNNDVATTKACVAAGMVDLDNFRKPMKDEDRVLLKSLLHYLVQKNLWTKASVEGWIARQSSPVVRRLSSSPPAAPDSGATATSTSLSSALREDTGGTSAVLIAESTGCCSFWRKGGRTRHVVPVSSTTSPSATAAKYAPTSTT